SPSSMLPSQLLSVPSHRSSVEVPIAWQTTSRPTHWVRPIAHAPVAPSTAQGMPASGHSTVPPRTANCQTPGSPTFDVVQRLRISIVNDPGSATKSVRLPASKPACAGVPPNPPRPPDASPVVHSHRLYRNSTS